MSAYYHAGAQREEDNETRWSNHTRLSLDAAIEEARRMARKRGDGWRGIVEWWDKEWGLRPGNSDAPIHTIYTGSGRHWKTCACRCRCGSMPNDAE